MPWNFKKTRNKEDDVERKRSRGSRAPHPTYHHIPTHATLDFPKETRSDFKERIREANHKRIEMEVEKEKLRLADPRANQPWGLKWPRFQGGALARDFNIVNPMLCEYQDNGQKENVTRDYDMTKNQAATEEPTSLKIGSSDDRLGDHMPIQKECISTPRPQVVGKWSSQRSSQNDAPHQSDIAGKQDSSAVYKHGQGRTGRRKTRKHYQEDEHLRTPPTDKSHRQKPSTPINFAHEISEGRKQDNCPVWCSFPVEQDDKVVTDLSHLQDSVIGYAVHRLHPVRSHWEKNTIFARPEHSPTKTTGRLDPSTLTQHPHGAPLPSIPIEDSPAVASLGDPLDNPLSLQSTAEKLDRLIATDNIENMSDTCHATPQSESSATETPNKVDSDSDWTLPDMPGKYPLEVEPQSPSLSCASPYKGHSPLYPDTPGPSRHRLNRLARASVTSRGSSSVPTVVAVRNPTVLFDKEDFSMTRAEKIITGTNCDVRAQQTGDPDDLIPSQAADRTVLPAHF